MARNDSLIRLHKTLSARRNELRKRLGMDLRDLTATSDGDAAETAFEAEGIELAGTLAAMETKELSRVEKAIVRLKKGTYGLCEACDARIPVARLNFMPTAELCISCQREAERDSSWLEDRRQERWGEMEEEHDHTSRREPVMV